MEKKTVQIENISKKNLETIVKALDFFLRIGLGQFEELVRVIERDTGFQWVEKEPAALLKEFKRRVTGFDENASYGITNKSVRQVFKDSYAMIKKMEQAIGILDNDLDTSLRKRDGDTFGLEEEPVIVVSIVEENEDEQT